jgi:glycosyltransferase involved in cell wall biosynthesis
MRILLIHQYYCPEGGSGNDRTRYFAEYFADQGHEVVVLTTQARFPDSLKGSETLRFRNANISVVAFPLPNTHALGYAARIRTFLDFYRFGLREEKKLGAIDCVYACSTPLTAGELGRVIARRRGVPFLFEVQDVWPDAAYGMGIIQNPILKWTLDFLTKRLYDDAHHILALSSDMVPWINRLGNISPKISIIPNGTDVQLFTPKSEKQRNPLQFIYAGAIGKANGLDQLVAAVRILKRRGINSFKLLIYGTGNRFERVKSLSVGLEDFIEWKGEVTKLQVAKEIQQASVGIVCFAPYKVLESNSANKFFDYLSAGLPVLVNYGGWQAKVLELNNCGLSSEPGNPEDLADKMAEMLLHPERLFQMGANARALALAQYDRRYLAGQVLDIIKHM